ncbi:hypothetical protein J6590_085161 [Homalodisca vitripennis]|nr:hypothetical protein J6590_085161 [Homalodisca vitripennis]
MKYEGEQYLPESKASTAESPLENNTHQLKWVGYLEPVIVLVTGYGVLPQVSVNQAHISRPRLPIYLGYKAVASLTARRFQHTISCHHLSVDLTQPPSDDILSDWVVINFTDKFPTNNDIWLAIERLIASSYFKENPQFLSVSRSRNNNKRTPQLVFPGYVLELCEVVGGIEDVVRSDHSGRGSDGEPDNDLHEVTAQQTTRRPAVRVPPPWSRTINFIEPIYTLYIHAVVMYAKELDLPRNEDFHSYYNRRANDYSLPAHHTTQYIKKPSYIGRKIINSLPFYLKTTPVNKLKKTLWDFLVERPVYSIREFLDQLGRNTI